MEQSRRKFSDSHQQETSKKKDKRRASQKSVYVKPHICYEPIGLSEFSAGQWNLHGQRLYPTMSDSAVCGYPYPTADYYPTTFPVCPVLSPNVYPTPMDSFRKKTRVRKKNKASETESQLNNNSNFTSLPPVNSEDVNFSQKRRFSDPGLNNVEESPNESLTSSGESISDSDCSYINNETLMEQITELKTVNKSLCCELETTKNEMKILKSELAIITSKVTCHEPFSIAQMVKEIRDATEAREKAMISKIETLIEGCLKSKNVTTIIGDIDSLKKRLTALERQLEHLRIHSKVDSKMNGDATIVEIDNAIIRKNEILDKITNLKISDNTDYTKEKESSCVERSDTNSEIVDSGSDCNGNSLSTMSCESLSSSLGPGSLHSATVTLCGPVTDL